MPRVSVVGGLLSAHLLSRRAGMQVEAGWPCSGPLLRLAEKAATKLLPGTSLNVATFSTFFYNIYAVFFFTFAVHYKLNEVLLKCRSVKRFANTCSDCSFTAFNTSTGMPYGTVNLKHGVPKGETTVACTAGLFATVEGYSF